MLLPNSPPVETTTFAGLYGDLAIGRRGAKYVALKEAASWSVLFASKDVPTSVKSLGIVEATQLSIQAFPNPFNSSTTIHLDLPFRSDVSIQIYNVLGQVVGAQAVHDLFPGQYRFPFTPESLSSGVYIIRASAGNQSLSIKTLFVK